MVHSVEHYPILPVPSLTLPGHEGALGTCQLKGTEQGKVAVYFPAYCASLFQCAIHPGIKHQA